MLMTLLLLLPLGHSCDKDDDGVDSNTNQLIGTWRLVSISDSDGFSENYPEDCQNTWEFTENRINAKWDEDCDGSLDYQDSAVYTLVGNEIVVPEEDEDLEITIVELNANSLTIQILDTFDPEDIYVETYVFTRV